MTTSKSLYVSVGLAILGVFLISIYINKWESELKYEFGEAQEVVVASEDINKNITITEKLITVAKVPRAYIQPGAARKLEDAMNSVSAVPIKKGEQLTVSKLYNLGSETGVSTQINLGMRAITIPVNDVWGVGKLIKPGDRVDVISSIDYGEGDSEDREIKTILQNIKVLAVGKYVTNNIPRIFVKDEYTNEIEKKDLNVAYNYNTVTLEVNPSLAQTLVFLITSGEGNVILALRNPIDDQIRDLKTSNVDVVLGPESFKAKRNRVIKKRSRPRWEEIRDSGNESF